VNLKLPDEVKDILDKFEAANFQIYVVGGAVRDLLMGRGVHDWDFTTDAKPEEILGLFPQGHYNNKFGTVLIGDFEITTMRKEGDYKDHRHPVEVSWTNKVEEDLARRDFTINALALDVKGQIVDPFSGQEDIEKGQIRAVGDPNKRFKEDALRLIRAIRIATEINFDIEKNTMDAIKKNAKLLGEVASERVRDELFKLLGSTNPYIGTLLLREAGILGIVLPEVEACFGVVQEGPKHERIYDIGEHSLLALKTTPSTDPLVRLAALLHDIGKVKTYKKDHKGNVTFYGHDTVGGEQVLKIAKRFNLSKKQSDKLYRLVRFHMFTVDENQTDSAIRRFIKNVGLENVDDMLALRVGDRLGGGTPTATSWRTEKFKERIKQVLHKPFSITDLKVNGTDVMKTLKIKPSRKVGEVLQKLFEEVQEDSSKNNEEYLLGRIKKLG
jgi:tRNA nucleotidyltransferase (CCA-adding enzyme)